MFYNNQFWESNDGSDCSNRKENNYKRQGRLNPAPKMMQIQVQFRKFGQYNIMETLDFGYRLSVKSNIKPDQNGMIVYDANNAQIMVNEKGYLCLYIN